MLKFSLNNLNSTIKMRNFLSSRKKSFKTIKKKTEKLTQFFSSHPRNCDELSLKRFSIFSKNKKKISFEFNFTFSGTEKMRFI